MKRIAQKDSKLSKDQVAALVKREVTVQDKVSLVDVGAEEVLDWAEYPETGEIVVVTIDGQRFTGKLKAEKSK